MIPSNFLVFGSVTGIPEILYSLIRAKASFNGWLGLMVTGSTTIPDSNFLTFLTSLAWVLKSRFLCITPNPPACAIAIAIPDSVTVSIAAEIKGIERVIFFVILV